MEEKKIHLVKKVSKELGMTYKELGERIGYSEGSLRRSVSTNHTSKQLQKAIELYLEVIKLKNNETNANTLKETLRTFMMN